MITVIIKRSDEPKVIQMTQADLVRQLGQIEGAEIMLEDNWSDGLKKVRTPYVTLIEPDAVFSANYFASNVGLLSKAHAKTAATASQPEGGGGYQKLAMIASCVGVRTYGERIYNYELKKIEDININGVTGEGWHASPCRHKLNMKLYHVQIGFVPGAIIRMSAIKDTIEDELWYGNDLVKLSTALSFYLWDTGRRIQLNPNTTYVSLDKNLENPPLFKANIPDKVKNIFTQEGIGWAS